MRAVGFDAAVVRDGPAALVPTCWAAGLDWDQVTRAEAGDFCRWLRIAGKPDGPHWRPRLAGDAGEAVMVPAAGGPQRGAPNPVTGKPAAGRTYAPATVAHCETVLRHFYDFHLDFGYAFATADGDVGRIQESEVRGAGWYPLAVAERLVGHRIGRAVSAPPDRLTGPR